MGRESGGRAGRDPRGAGPEGACYVFCALALPAGGRSSEGFPDHLYNRRFHPWSLRADFTIIKSAAWRQPNQDPRNVIFFVLVRLAALTVSPFWMIKNPKHHEPDV